MRNPRSCIPLLFLPAAIVLVVAVGLMAVVNVRGNLSMLEFVYLRIWLSGYDNELAASFGTDDTPVIFVVNPGETADTIGQNLVSAALISDAKLFRQYARYHGLDSQLEAGTYFLNAAQTIPEIAQQLTDSRSASVTVQIIEGWRREQIAEAIDANPYLPFSGADFLAATGPGTTSPPGFAEYVSLPEGASLEGFLYPETYFLPPDVTAVEFRDTLLETFVQRIDLTLKSGAEQAGMTLYQAVTLASIIEREAVLPEEQPVIASVYLNRLAIGMKLDADPTVQYGIGYRNGSWWPTITQEDYRTALSPYNTYLNAGLPPGPIASPSRAAIATAIYPAETGFYYFRADCVGSGAHVFAVTYEEHVANGNCQ